jgi:hypothetical protein
MFFGTSLTQQPQDFGVMNYMAPPPSRQQNRVYPYPPRDYGLMQTAPPRNERYHDYPIMQSPMPKHPNEQQRQQEQQQ